MNARDGHLFTFSGEKIAEAAQTRAMRAAVAVAETRRGLQTAKAELVEVIEQAVDLRMAAISMGHEPPPFDGGPTMSATSGARLVPGVECSWEVNLALPQKKWNELLDIRRRLRDATHDYDLYTAAAARYRSQRNRDFDLDADDVAHFGLDKESA